MPPKNNKVDVFKNYIMSTDKDTCWIWRGTWGGRARDKRPYYQYATPMGSERTLAYRIVYELVSGVTLAPSEQILHSCDHGGFPIGCGNPHHLRIGTHADNMDDMVARQRHGMSQHTYNSIKKLLAGGQHTHGAIAEVHGVSRETVTAINNGRGAKR